MELINRLQVFFIGQIPEFNKDPTISYIFKSSTLFEKFYREFLLWLKLKSIKVWKHCCFCGSFPLKIGQFYHVFSVNENAL